ncbi:hypothetical protein PanWU01x14_345740 [Parasponia andersonii]|uniref:Uncharacterized protein n=1 Tax=Parasponia andersonii TaxID=3476 RepID=A0A2P5ACK4_PARAD|nr:hypothetical protein PanWU01x14_345740 [Parasponia andersonii]
MMQEPHLKLPIRIFHSPRLCSYLLIWALLDYNTPNNLNNHSHRPIFFSLKSFLADEGY